MFYQRLSLLCEREGVSISVFTQMVLGLNASTATGWKRGASPNSAVVVRAAEHFHVSADYLLGLSESPQRFPREASAQPPEAAEAAALLQNASPTARQAGLAALRATVEAIDGSAAGCSSSPKNDSHRAG